MHRKRATHQQMPIYRRRPPIATHSRAEGCANSSVAQVRQQKIRSSTGIRSRTRTDGRLNKLDGPEDMHTRVQKKPKATCLTSHNVEGSRTMLKKAIIGAGTVAALGALVFGR